MHTTSDATYALNTLDLVIMKRDDVPRDLVNPIGNLDKLQKLSDYATRSVRLTHHSSTLTVFITFLFWSSIVSRPVYGI